MDQNHVQPPTSLTIAPSSKTQNIFFGSDKTNSFSMPSLAPYPQPLFHSLLNPKFHVKHGLY